MKTRNYSISKFHILGHFIDIREKAVTGIAPACISHTHTSSFYLFISTTLLKEKKWLLRTSGLFSLGFHVVKINSGYQLQFQRLSRRIKEKKQGGGKKNKGRQCSLTVVFAQKNGKKKKIFNFLHNIVVLPLSSESYLFMLLRKPHRANIAREEQDVFSTRLLADSSCCKTFIFRNSKRSRKNFCEFQVPDTLIHEPGILGVER